MRVVQLLPELNEGGVERGVVELNRELVKKGVESLLTVVYMSRLMLSVKTH